MSYPKEPHYFATDFPNYRRVRTAKDYLDLFKKANRNHHSVGEGSVFYLYSKRAMDNILEFNSDAKIIAMARNPAEIAYSMHSQLRYSRDEDEAHFTKAWELIGQRKKGTEIPQRCRDKKILYYDEIAKLGEQFERMMSVFPREQIKIIFFEDFITNPAQVYQDVLKFLDLPGLNKRRFARINQNKQHRNESLANFTERPPLFLVNIGKVLKNALGLRRVGFVYVLKALRALNKVQEPRHALPDDFRMKIVSEYRDDINRLARLTGKDLTRWLQ
jgi:hypothetical protein